MVIRTHPKVDIKKKSKLLHHYYQLHKNKGFTYFGFFMFIGELTWSKWYKKWKLVVSIVDIITLSKHDVSTI